MKGVLLSHINYRLNANKTERQKPKNGTETRF